MDYLTHSTAEDSSMDVQFSRKNVNPIDVSTVQATLGLFDVRGPHAMVDADKLTNASGNFCVEGLLEVAP